MKITFVYIQLNETHKINLPSFLLRFLTWPLENLNAACVTFLLDTDALERESIFSPGEKQRVILHSPKTYRADIHEVHGE